jgi:hypothetical protein
MQMMNKAIEDAADFSEFQRKLLEETRKHAHQVLEAKSGSILDALASRQDQPRRPGENREQYRARIFGKAKA